MQFFKSITGNSTFSESGALRTFVSPLFSSSHILSHILYCFDSLEVITTRQRRG